MPSPKLSYDPESKTLSIRISKVKSIDSDIYDNVVVDYAKDGKIVNVDIMDISLSEFQHSPEAKKMFAIK